MRAPRALPLCILILILSSMFIVMLVLPLIVEVTESLSASLAFTSAFLLSMLVLVVDWWKRATDTERVVMETRDTIIRELRRNHCFADGSTKNLISTGGWDLFTKVASHFNKNEVDILLDCYTAMTFYNHDVFFGPDMATEKKEKKQQRVLLSIKNTLLKLGGSVPTKEKCEGILKDFGGRKD